MIQKINKTQKVIKVGNSYAVTLDRTFVESAGIKPGDHVAFQYDLTSSSAALSLRDAPENSHAATEGKKLTKTEKEKYLSKEITPEYQAWVKETLEEDREAMEALANL